MPAIRERIEYERAVEQGSLEYSTPQRPPQADKLFSEALLAVQHKKERGSSPPFTPFNIWACCHLYSILESHEKDMLTLSAVYSSALSAQPAYEQLVVGGLNKTATTAACQLYVDNELDKLHGMTSRLESISTLLTKISTVMRNYEGAQKYHREMINSGLKRAAEKRAALNVAVKELNEIAGECRFSTANRLVSCYNCALDAYLVEYKKLMDTMVTASHSYRELLVKMFQLHKQAVRSANQDFRVLGMATVLYPSTLAGLRNLYCEQFVVCGIMQVVQKMFKFDTQFTAEVLPDISLVALPVQSVIGSLGLVLSEPNTVHYAVRILRTCIIGDGVAGTEELALMGCESAFGPQFEEPETASVSSQGKDASFSTTVTKLESDTSVYLTPSVPLDMAELPLA